MAAKRFIIKQTQKRVVSQKHLGNNTNVSEVKKVEQKIVEEPKKVETKKIEKKTTEVENIKEEIKVSKIDKDMDTKEKIEMVNQMLQGEEMNGTIKKNVKKIKNDKGLIERTDITKTVITEDNRELLND